MNNKKNIVRIRGYLYWLVIALFADKVFGYSEPDRAHDFYIEDDEIVGRTPQIGYNDVYDGIGNVALSESGFNESYSRALRNINPDFMQFPGGNQLFNYNWKQAIGPREERPLQVNSFGNSNQYGPLSGAWGPDEAAQFAELTGAHLVVAVTRNRSASDAADLVEYMTSEVGENVNGGIDWAQVRAQNGRVEPYRVFRWQIGNESSSRSRLIWANYPSDGDNNISGSTRPLHFSPYSQGTQYHLYGGTRAFTSQLAVTETNWNSEDIRSTGEINQQRFVKFPPVAPFSYFKLRVGAKDADAIEWVQVENFHDSSSQSKHYTLDRETGKISFGDGINGAIPAVDKLFYVDYSSGSHEGFSAYYNQMKEVNPRISISTTHFGVIRNFGLIGDVPIDAMQRHHAYAHPSEELSFPINTNFYNECAARGSGAFGDYVDNIRENLYERNLVPLSRGLELDEIMYNFGLRDFIGIKHYQTMCSALVYSLIIDKVIENRDIIDLVGFNYFSPTNGRDWGNIEPGGVMRPQALAISMFTRYFGKNVLPTNNLNTRKRFLNYYSIAGELKSFEIDDIVVRGSLDGRGNLYVMVINTTRGQSIRRTGRIRSPKIQFQGLRPENTRVLQLSADGRNSVNTIIQPNRISIKDISSLKVDYRENFFTHTYPPSSITVLRFDNVVLDEDSDGISDYVDNCHLPNRNQLDLDRDNIGNECDFDIDGDGIPNSFERRNGLNELVASDANEDPDLDGLPNLKEFIFRSDPNTPDLDINLNGIPDDFERRVSSISSWIEFLLDRSGFD